MGYLWKDLLDHSLGPGDGALVAAAPESLEEISEPWVEWAVGTGEALVVDAEKLLEIVLDDVLERIGPGARSVSRDDGGDVSGQA